MSALGHETPCSIARKFLAGLCIEHDYCLFERDGLRAAILGNRLQRGDRFQ